MGVDTKLICLTKVKDESLILKTIQSAILDLIEKAKRQRPELSSQINKVETTNKEESWSFPKIYFDLLGEKRQLSIFLNCDSDDEELFGTQPKIHCSLGCWGRSEEIITEVAHALIRFGKTYTLMNDCSGEEYKELSNLEHLIWKKKKSIKHKMRNCFNTISKTD